MKIGKNFAKRMRETMYRKNLKQADIAERTGIPTSAVTMYYNGKYLPKSRNLKLIAQVLEVSESWLLDDDNSNEEEKLITIYRSLSEVKKKLLLEEAIKLIKK